MNTIKNGWEERDNAPHSGTPTSVTDEFHMEHVKPVLECTRSTSCTGIAREDAISPASIYLTLTNSLGKQTVCEKWIPHMLNNDQGAMYVLLATSHLQSCRNEGNVFPDHILWVDVSWTHSFDPQLKQKNAEWHTQTLRGRKLYVSVIMLLKSCTSCSSAEVDLCITILCQLVQWSTANITAHSCRIR